MPLLEYKLLENEVLTACRMPNGNDNGYVHPHKKSYVVCPGLIYGLGEESESCFYKLLIKAFNGCAVEELPIIGDGSNIVPTIHINDLTKIITKLVTNRPDPREHPYFLAVDKAGPAQTQAAIFDAVCKRTGLGAVPKIQCSEVKDKTMCQLAINLNMKTSDYFNDTIQWHAEKGLIGSIEKVFDELRMIRGLRCVKVMLTGPPASGKTHFSDWYFWHFQGYNKEMITLELGYGRHMEFQRLEQRMFLKRRRI